MINYIESTNSYLPILTLYYVITGKVRFKIATDNKCYHSKLIPNSRPRFLNKHTSEDNASYKEIVAEESAKLDKQADDLYDPSLEYHPNLAIGCTCFRPLDWVFGVG